MVRSARLYTLLFLINPVEKRVLLIRKKRGFGMGLWNGIGGKVEDGESVEEALLREAREEVGVTPLNPSWRGVLLFTNTSPEGFEDMLVHVFTATQFEGVPHESDEAFPEWFSLDALPWSEMWADDPYWLPLVLEEKRVSGVFHFTQWELKEWHVWHDP